MNFSIDKKGYKPQEVDAYLKSLATQYSSVVEAQRVRIDELRDSLTESQAKICAYKEKTGQITTAILNAVDKADEIEKLSKAKYNQEIARLRAFHEKWIAYYNRILQKYPIDEDLMAAGEFSQKVRKILANSDTATDNQGFKIPNALENTFESEKQRLLEKQIGYITIKTDGQKDGDDVDDILKMLPDADLSSPIISGDPVERIRQFLHAQRQKDNKPTANTKTKKRKKDDETAATSQGFSVGVDFLNLDNSFDFSDSSSDSNGFSFDEALNPKDDLATIMRDLGVLLD